MKSAEKAVAILEKLREKWGNISYFLDKTADRREDLAAVLNMAQQRVVEKCSEDLYGAIGDIKEIW